MNIPLFGYGLIELVFSIITALLIFVFGIKFFSVIAKTINATSELRESNKSVAVFVSGFIFALTIMIKTTIPPIVSTIKQTFENPDFALVDTVFMTARILSYYILAGIFALIIIWLAVKLFILFTFEIDEMNEIRDGNSAISIILSGLIISISLILADPLTTLLKGIGTYTGPSSPDLKAPIINTGVFIEGLIGTGIAIIGSIFIFFISFKFFTYITKNAGNLNELKKNNNSIAILISGFIFGVMIIVKASISPAQSILANMSIWLSAGFLPNLLLALGLIMLYFLIGGFFSFIVLSICMKIFFVIIKDDKRAEKVIKNNPAVSLVISFLIIALSILIERGITTTLNGISVITGLISQSNINGL